MNLSQQRLLLLFSQNARLPFSPFQTGTSRPYSLLGVVSCSCHGVTREVWALARPSASFPAWPLELPLQGHTGCCRLHGRSLPGMGASRRPYQDCGGRVDMNLNGQKGAAAVFTGTGSHASDSSGGMWSSGTAQRPLFTDVWGQPNPQERREDTGGASCFLLLPGKHPPPLPCPRQVLAFPSGGLPLPRIAQPLLQVEQTLSQDGCHHLLPLGSRVPGNCTQKTCRVLV